MIRILLVDDQPLFVQSLKMSIESYVEDIRIVGIAKTGLASIDMAEQYEPDVILMDVHLPDINGVEATRRILEKHKKIKIIMLSTYDEDEYVRKALRIGSAGYLLKDISPTELIAAIRALQSGLVQISPKIAAKLINTMYNGTSPKAPDATNRFEWFETLTCREKEIFGLIATGYDNQQIAEKLSLAEQTVRNNISLIYAKLEVKDRFEIIRLANMIEYH
ncbi:response regulator transcription factor [uncultured Sphaerochaeta sp.]|uniref:response regulator transcription factor n=1 Tax=uncultured Sphaerochaeta sp. TaxID=886478 RepID=UPI002A0A5A8D|nr:response regulator transcription factor [uncultured Sphaerochaeta sp.]